MAERVLVGTPADICPMSDLPSSQCWHCRPPVEEPPSLEPEPHPFGERVAWPGLRTDTFISTRVEASGGPGHRGVVYQQIGRRYGHAPDTVADDDWDA